MKDSSKTLISMSDAWPIVKVSSCSQLTIQLRLMGCSDIKQLSLNRETEHVLFLGVPDLLAERLRFDLSVVDQWNVNYTFEVVKSPDFDVRIYFSNGVPSVASGNQICQRVRRRGF